jgi:hypothetical protein
VRDEIVFEHTRDLGTAGLVGSKRCALGLAPDFLGHFALQVSDLVRKTPSPKRSWKHLLESADQARRAVGRPENQIREAWVDNTAPLSV